MAACADGQDPSNQRDGASARAVATDSSATSAQRYLHAVVMLSIWDTIETTT